MVNSQLTAFVALPSWCDNKAEVSGVLSLPSVIRYIAEIPWKYFRWWSSWEERFSYCFFVLFWDSGPSWPSTLCRSGWAQVYRELSACPCVLSAGLKSVIIPSLLSVYLVDVCVRLGVGRQPKVEPAFTVKIGNIPSLEEVTWCQFLLSVSSPLTDSLLTQFLA